MQIRDTIPFERPYRPSQGCYPVRIHNRHYPLLTTWTHSHDKAHINCLTNRLLHSFIQMVTPDTHKSATSNPHNCMRVHKSCATTVHIHFHFP